MACRRATLVGYRNQAAAAHDRSFASRACVRFGRFGREDGPRFEAGRRS